MPTNISGRIHQWHVSIQQQSTAQSLAAIRGPRGCRM
jgi:hypothetical protein